jgi:DNA-binding NtrC family response regulator
VSIRLPPLRERPEDIAVLVRDAVCDACALQGLPRRMVDAETMARLMEYGWPGNIRELRNVMAAAVLRSASPSIAPNDLPSTIHVSVGAAADERRPAGADQPFFAALAAFESSYLAALLSDTGGNISEAARRAGLSRSAVRTKARQYGLLTDGPIDPPPVRRQRVRGPGA